MLVFKDLGIQLGWRFVYVVEYAGPLIMFPALYYFPQLFYGQAAERTFSQKVGMAMAVGHFLKRELESLFLHRFSNATMPLANLFVNCGYYWVLHGLFIGYFLFHPQYTEPSFAPSVKYGLIAAFLGSEFMNFLCHKVLRDLRPPGTRKRGIPHGFGFELVSCANYFWEVIAWVCFAVFTKTVPSYVFLLGTVYILSKWSMARHKRYIKEFDGKEGKPLYPKSRKALIPFIY